MPPSSFATLLELVCELGPERLAAELQREFPPDELVLELLHVISQAAAGEDLAGRPPVVVAIDSHKTRH